ncbi:hypothetical protein JYT90_00055 [bacterium AH-315-P07]|nr:hypothetical protein [bacterium AH-315-P07]
MNDFCRLMLILVACTALLVGCIGTGEAGLGAPERSRQNRDVESALQSLPDPLRTSAGKRIKSAKQWRKHRETLVNTIIGIEYGHAPGRPEHPPITELIESAIHRADGAVFDKYVLHFGLENRLSTTLHLYIPDDGSATHPVIVRFGLGGEHAKAANDRGYAFACFDQQSLDPDTEGHDIVGPAQAMYPDYDWGSLSVWAWGASRVLDFLETRDDIDIRRSVITGHSRTGKAALLTGVLDQRFAIVVPNGSGAGGAATFRGAGKGVETLELITRASRFKSWFHEDFGRFGDDVEQLPFDQHFMRALIAPRVVLSTDARGDIWANPPGVEAAWIGAQPVFDLLGVPENNRIHFREGGHDQLPPDFAHLLDVADRYFHK